MKRIKQFFSQFAKKLTSISARKLITALLCAVCILIPSILAVSVIFSKPEESKPNRFSVSLYDENRVLIASEEGTPATDGKNSLLDICYNIFTTSQKIAKAPIPPEEATPIYASVNHNGAEAEYVCYFSFLNGSSYYTDANANVFSITPENASAFLSSPHAEILYSKAAPPRLFTNVDEEIIPSSVSWYYRLYDDSYREATNYQITAEALSYNFSSILDLRFETEPDVCTVRIFESGTLVYEGPRDKISSLIFTNGNNLRININASWNEHSGVLYHGDVSYSFDALIVDRAEFSVNTDTLKIGGFLTLTCTNADDISQIKFTSSTSFSPFFCRDGKKVLALIPYPDNSESNSFDFSVTYGSSSRSFSISLDENTVSNKFFIDENDAQAYAIMSEVSIIEALNIISEVSKKAGSTVYFRGNFNNPADMGFSKSYSFGDTISNSDESVSAYALGNEYSSSYKDQSVGALCAGKVIATGNSTSLGNYVAVDHGLGLVTWYCHLSDFDTEVGATLATNESVGKSGGGGFDSQNGVLILLSLNGKIIDPSVIDLIP